MNIIFIIALCLLIIVFVVLFILAVVGVIGKNKCAENFKNENKKKSIRVYGKKDGFGAQYLSKIGGLAQARKDNLCYCHFPFEEMGHINNQEYVDRLESLGGLKSDKCCDVNDMETLHHPQKVLYSSNPSLYYTDEVKNELRSMYNQENISKKDDCYVAIHARRGDTVKGNNPRFTSDENIDKTVNYMLNKFPDKKICLFSEGKPEDFSISNKDKIEFHLDEDVIDSFNSMVQAPHLVYSKSTFSYAAAILNENNVYVGDNSFWHKPLSDWETIESDNVEKFRSLSGNSKGFDLLLTIYNVPERNSMYQDVIKYYVDNGFPLERIFLVDSANNGISYDLIPKEQQAVFIQSNDGIPDYKYYRMSFFELQSLEYAFKNLSFNEPYIIKLTGKYKIPELLNLDLKLDDSYDLILSTEKTYGQNSEILGFNKKNMIEILEQIKTVEDDTNLESKLKKISSKTKNEYFPFLSNIGKYKRTDGVILKKLSG